MGTRDEDGPLLYSCPSCGSSFLASVAAHAPCPYCGVELQPAGEPQNVEIAAHLVPFAISRDQAAELLQRRLRRKAPLRKDGIPTIESAQAVFVPHHLFDVFVHGEVGFHGKSETGHRRNSTTYYSYQMRVRGYGEYEVRPLCSSARLPADVTKGIGSYNLSKTRLMDLSRLEECLVETPPKATTPASLRAQELAYDSFVASAEKYVHETARELVPCRGTVLKSEYLGNEFRIKIEGEPEDWGHKTAVLETRLLFLPMWLVRCVWKGEHHLFVVNGQTGVCVGDAGTNAEALTFFDPHNKHGAHLHERTIFRDLRTVMVFPYYSTYSWYSTTAMSVPKDVYMPRDRSSRRRTAMLDFATKACEAYNLQAASLGINTSTLTLPPKCFVPFCEDQIPLFDSALGNDLLHGSALTDAGLRCVPIDQLPRLEECYFTSWEEFAWFGRPYACAQGGLLYSGGNAVAYLPHDTRLQVRFLRLFVELWQRARQTFGWEWVVSTQPAAAAETVMSNTVHALCQEAAPTLVRDEPPLSDEVRSLLRLGKYEEVLLAHDDSRYKGENCAFAITARGFTCRKRNTNLSARFVGWKELSEAPELRLDGENICADDAVIACYSGNRSTLEALLVLCEELHAKAREAYSGRTALYLMHRYKT